MTHEVL